MFVCVQGMHVYLHLHERALFVRSPACEFNCYILQIYKERFNCQHFIMNIVKIVKMILPLRLQMASFFSFCSE